MDKFLVVDGNSIFNRAFYGIRALTTGDGLPTNAVYGFINILLKNISLCGEVKYGAVAFDLKAPTFRHKRYSEYKANRKGMPEELALQLPYAKDAARYLGFTVLEKEGFEADDILGTLAKKAENEGLECVIVTGDRDSLQLVSEKVSVYLAATNETKIFTPESFEEKYGVSPDKFVDVKALMGDSSDNIPGVKGIGEKGALKLISEYGSLERLFDDIDNIKGSTGEKLKSGKDSAYLSRELATIFTEVEVPESLDEYLVKRDGAKLMELCEMLELKQLVSRLGLAQEQKKELSEEYGEKKAFVLTDAESAKLAFEGADLIYLHTDGERICVCDGKALFYSFPLDKGAECFFKAHGKALVYWSYKETAERLLQLDIEISEPKDDISLLSYVAHPTEGGNSSPLRAARAAGLEAGDGDLESETAILPLLCETLKEQAAVNGQMVLYRNIELKLSSVLLEMQKLGFEVDKDGLLEYSRILTGFMKEAEEAIYSLAGEEFNINSPKQLSTILFERLGLPHFKKTQSGYSTDADVMKKLEKHHPIVGLILQYRHLSKLNGTYAEGLVKAIDPKDGRIHTTFKQTLTQTGRLSSTEPNLQNIPVRTDLGKVFRKFFVAKEGHVLIDADYSQIELRLLAHMANDPEMTRAFKAGEDIHAATAAQVFGVPLSAVNEELRKRAKAVNFGIVYGIGAFSLAEDLGVSRKDAADYIESYFKRFPAVKDYLNATVAKAKEDGYVTTVFGRRRYIPELKAKNKNLVSFGERAAMNTPIQGTAADIIKKAMVETDAALKKQGLKAKLILQIHDELIVEAPENEAETVKKLLTECMENACKLTVPLSVDVGVGKNWFEAKK